MSATEPPSISLIHVPSDVGSIIPGKSKAPAAFREVDIVGKLNDAGYTSVREYYALSLPAKYSASSISPSGVRNDVANIAVCEAVRDTVTGSLNNDADRKSDGEMKPPFQLILGGECCMLPAVLSAFWRHHAHISPINPSPKRVGLIYIDADTDLSVPSISPSSSGT
jgi:arginase